MDALIKSLITIAVTGLLSLTIWLQHNEVVAGQEENASLNQAILDRDATIKHLQEAEANNQKRLTRLQSETRRISVTLAERETIIGRLQHDNPEIQIWANTALPDAVIRLRQHDAATGAGDAHPELPDDQPLRAASSASDDER